MRRRIWVSLIALVIGTGAIPQTIAATQQHEREHERNVQQERERRSSDDGQYSERDEFNQTYELSSGARVEVKGINGTVDIQTAAGSRAEVQIIRSARNREDLNYRKIIVEHSGNSLVVRGEKEEEQDRSARNRNVRHRVTLRLPRQVDLTVSGVNGRATVGEIDGPVTLSGINGRVDVAHAIGYSHISGINGRVTITISRLSERGIDVSGVNGGVELRFTDEVNADVDVTGINGQVHAEVPDVTVFGKMDRHNFKAKIGAGGNPIKVNGVNGAVRINRADSAR
jgi:hypothetical protein